jgi:hypothetical protein
MATSRKTRSGPATRAAGRRCGPGVGAANQSSAGSIVIVLHIDPVAGSMFV